MLAIDSTSEAARLPSPEDVLAAVVEITREASHATTDAAIADAVVRIATLLIGADQGTLGLVRGGEVMTVAALIPPRQPVGSAFPVGFGVAGWVAATGRPAEIQDVRQDKRYVALPYPEVRSFVGLPLCAGDELVGVLSLAAWRPAAFASNTADALAPLAEHAALLLKSVAATRELRERIAALEMAAREGLAESLHELKSPLHAAAGFLELVADEQAGLLNEQQKEFLNFARVECGRVKDTLATLVETTAAAQRPLDLRLVQAADVVTACVHRFRGQAMQREVTLSAQIERSVGAVLADSEALQQVLANFVQNALRLVPRGSDVVVSARAESDWTCFSVSDSGPGLPDGQADSLFEPYTQGELKEAGSVGLGLSIARRIVEQHHGRVWATNREAGGATFSFALPTPKLD
jgi:K+-sensing histidine kinase KdpD